MASQWKDGPDLPVDIYDHKIIALNEDQYMMVGGRYNATPQGVTDQTW